MSLELKNITKSFGEKNILSSLSYSFCDTGIYALTGESGVGKTTLLRIIAGLDCDFGGEVIRKEKKISFAFQEYRLFPSLSALDNVIFANYDRKDEAVIKKAEKILFKLGLDKEDIDLLPKELSGGMKQRVSLARALISDAPIILLDEPTKELDQANASIVRSLISQVGKERLVIMSSHNEADLSIPNLKLINL